MARNGHIITGLSGWIHGSGVGELTDVGCSRFTGSAYMKILDEVFLPSVKAMVFPDLEPSYIIQDNIPINTSSV